MAGVDLYLSGVVFLLGTGPGCGVEAGVGQPGSQSSREEVVGTDAEERHRVSFVSKSPSRSWACAGFVQGIAWRGEKGIQPIGPKGISVICLSWLDPGSRNLHPLVLLYSMLASLLGRLFPHVAANTSTSSSRPASYKTAVGKVLLSR